MNENAELFLDRWEEKCVKAMDATPMTWLARQERRVAPWKDLQPTDPYPFRDYLRLCSKLSGIMFTVWAITGLIFVALIWHAYPDSIPMLLNGNPRVRGLLMVIQPFLIICVLTPFVVTFLVFLVGVPNYYFWNRRATRPRLEGVPETTPTPQAVDATTWPPAPTTDDER